MIAIRRLAALPEGFQALQAEARAEGYDHMDRLADEAAGLFASGEAALFEARLGAELAGIGGLTPDPYDPAPRLLRLRRFYVRPFARRSGLGRRLVEAVLREARERAYEVSLRAPDARAARFWESLGFVREETPARTHVLRL